VRVTLGWQALVDIDKDYTVFIHLVGLDHRISAQQDGAL